MDHPDATGTPPDTPSCAKEPTFGSCTAQRMLRRMVESTLRNWCVLPPLDVTAPATAQNATALR
jgi:hypothetical protein